MAAKKKDTDTVTEDDTPKKVAVAKKVTKKVAVAKKATKKAVKKVAKKAAKKVAKKAAKKGPRKPVDSAETEASFRLLDRGKESVSNASKALVKALERRAGREIRLVAQSDVEIDRLPVSSIYMQWMLNSRGIPRGVTNIIGKDGVGKTSFVYSLLGRWMLNEIPACVLVCEGKGLSREWAARCLSTSRDLGLKMSDVLPVFDMAQLDQMFETLKAYLKYVRDPAGKGYVPKHIPVVVVGDPINKLGTKAQAAGIMVYNNLIKADESDPGDRGHSLDRARWYHDFMNRLHILRFEHNIHFVAVEHQNQKDPMGSAKKTKFVQQDWQIDAANRTKPGGEGVNQSTGLQLSLVNRGKVYSEGLVVGHRILVTSMKNSFGPPGRSCCFAIKSEDLDDTAESLDAGIRWDWTEVEWLAETRLLGWRKTGASLTDEKFTCELMGIHGQPLVEAARIWALEGHMYHEELGRSLKIPGYLGTREKIIGELRAAFTGTPAKVLPPKVAGTSVRKPENTEMAPPPPPPPPRTPEQEAEDLRTKLNRACPGAVDDQGNLMPQPIKTEEVQQATPTSFRPAAQPAEPFYTKS